jgi:hypothetical protein
LQDSTKQVAALTEELDTYLAAAQQRAKSQHESLTACSSARAASDANSVAGEAEIAKLREQLAVAKTEVTKITAQLSAQAVSLKECESAKATSVEDLATERAAVAQVQAELAAKAAEVAKLQADLATSTETAQDNTSKLAAQTEKLQAATNTARREGEQFRLDRERVTAESVAAAERAAADHAAATAKLQTEIDESRAKLAECGAAQRSKTEEECKRNLETRLAELQAANAKIAELEARNQLAYGRLGSGEGASGNTAAPAIVYTNALSAIAFKPRNKTDKERLKELLLSDLMPDDAPGLNAIDPDVLFSKVKARDGGYDEVTFLHNKKFFATKIRPALVEAAKNSTATTAVSVYGSSGSGKTYTMVGAGDKDDADPGVFQQTLAYFQGKEEHEDDKFTSNKIELQAFELSIGEPTFISVLPLNLLAKFPQPTAAQVASAIGCHTYSACPVEAPGADHSKTPENRELYYNLSQPGSKDELKPVVDSNRSAVVTAKGGRQKCQVIARAERDFVDPKYVRLNHSKKFPTPTTPTCAERVGDGPNNMWKGNVGRLTLWKEGATLKSTQQMQSSVRSLLTEARCAMTTPNNLESSRTALVTNIRATVTVNGKLTERNVWFIDPPGWEHAIVDLTDYKKQRAVFTNMTTVSSSNDQSNAALREIRNAAITDPTDRISTELVNDSSTDGRSSTPKPLPGLTMLQIQAKAINALITSIFETLQRGSEPTTGAAWALRSMIGPVNNVASVAALTFHYTGDKGQPINKDTQWCDACESVKRLLTEKDPAG